MAMLYRVDECFIIGAVQHPEAQYVTLPEI